MPGPAWTSATPTLSRGPSKRGPRLGEDGGRTQNAGCTVPAPVSSERKQLLLFVKGGLRKKSEDVCLHPGFCLWNILEHQVPVTGDGREPSGWRAAGVRVCSGIIPSAPRALWGGHQTILSWTAPSSRDSPSPCAKLSPLSHCWVLAISQVRFSEASPDQTLF